MAIVKVNRLGAQHKIYESNAATTQIGTLYNNEMFTWIEEWSGSGASGFYIQAVMFRASDGKPKVGWISGRQTDKVFETNICTLANFIKVINQKTYYGFKMRRDEELYDRNANIISNKKAYQGRRILCESSTAGNTHRDWLAVKYLETGVGTNSYAEIVSGQSAFVDLGYDQGSTFNTNCSLIGSL